MKRGSAKRLGSDEDVSEEDERAAKRPRRPLLSSGVCKHFDEETKIGVIECGGQEVWFVMDECVEDRSPLRGEVLTFEATENNAGDCEVLKCRRAMKPAHARDRGRRPPEVLGDVERRERTMPRTGIIAGDCKVLKCRRATKPAHARDRGRRPPEVLGDVETRERTIPRTGIIERGPMLVSGVCMQFEKQSSIGWIEWNGQDVGFSIYDCVDQREPSRGEVLIFKAVEHFNEEEGFKYLTCKCVMTPEQIRDRGNGAYWGICVTFNHRQIERGICLKAVHLRTATIRVDHGKCIYGYLRVEDCIGTYPRQGDLLKFDLEECTEVKNRIVVRAVTGGTAAKHFHGMRWEPFEGFRVRTAEEALPDGW